MATVTQPLREEHKELWPHVAALRTTADAVGEVPLEVLQRGIDEAQDFLAHHLLAHAQAEERALYPVVQKVMGAPEAPPPRAAITSKSGVSTRNCARSERNWPGRCAACCTACMRC